MTSQVAVVTGDLLDRTRIEEAVRRAGLEPVTLADLAAVEEALGESVPGVALVDLRVGEGERIIGLLFAAGWSRGTTSLLPRVRGQKAEADHRCLYPVLQP